MSHALTLELSAEAFETLSRQAATAGVPPARLVADDLERRYGRRPDREAARGEFEKMFGTVEMEGPVGADNEQIDADLAREYGRGLD